MNVVYLIFRSICRNTGVSEDDIQNYLRSLPNGVLPLEHKSEFQLAKTILKFTDCILNILDNFLLHQVGFFASERIGISFNFSVFMSFRHLEKFRLGLSLDCFV